GAYENRLNAWSSAYLSGRAKWAPTQKLPSASGTHQTICAGIGVGLRSTGDSRPISTSPPAGSAALTTRRMPVSDTSSTDTATLGPIPYLPAAQTIFEPPRGWRRAAVRRFFCSVWLIAVVPP